MFYLDMQNSHIQISGFVEVVSKPNWSDKTPLKSSIDK